MAKHLARIHGTEEDKVNCFTTDMEVLTAEGFMGYDDLRLRFSSGRQHIVGNTRAYEGSGDLKVAGYDPMTDQIVYERPKLFIDNDPDPNEVVYEISSEKESAYWNNNLDESRVRGDEEDNSHDGSSQLSLRLTGGHELHVRRGIFENKFSAFGVRTETSKDLSKSLLEERQSITKQHNLASKKQGSCVDSSVIHEVNTDSDPELLFASIESKQESGTYRTFYDIFDRTNVKDVVEGPKTVVDNQNKVHRVGVQFKASATNGVAGTPVTVAQRMPMLGQLQLDTDEKVEAFLEWFGFWLGNGSVESGSLRVTFKEEVTAWMDSVLRRMGLVENEYSFCDSSGSHGNQVDVLASRFVSFIQSIHRDKTGEDTEKEHKGSVKLLPGWVWQLNRTEKQFVIRGMIRAGSGFMEGAGAVYTSSVRSRDELVHFATDAGYSATFSRKNRDIDMNDVPTETWRVSFGMDSESSHLAIPVSDIKQIEYSGRTWCLNMPSGFLIARRVYRGVDGRVLQASKAVIVRNCPFYFKIGACRHSDRCSRLHHKPAFSPTLLIKHVYRHPVRLAELNPSPTGEVVVDKEKAQEDFFCFFEDMFVELSKFGIIDGLYVADNLGDHLIGHVYCKFRDEEEASDALQVMNGRFYDGRQMEVEFSPVTDFREARCRDYDEGSCARGGFCNFLHVKPVPMCLICSLEEDCEIDRRREKHTRRDSDRDERRRRKKRRRREEKESRKRSRRSRRSSSRSRSRSVSRSRSNSRSRSSDGGRSDGGDSR